MTSIYSTEYQLALKALKNARINIKITQTQLAQSLGKPQSFVAKYEMGERRLDFVEFIQIAKLIELDLLPLIEQINPLRPIYFVIKKDT